MRLRRTTMRVANETSNGTIPTSNRTRIRPDGGSAAFSVSANCERNNNLFCTLFFVFCLLVFLDCEIKLSSSVRRFSNSPSSNDLTNQGMQRTSKSTIAVRTAGSNTPTSISSNSNRVRHLADSPAEFSFVPGARVM